MADLESNLRGLTRSVGSIGLLNLASMAIAFPIGVLLARQLGASNYGIYGLALTSATLAGMVAEIGFPMLTVREIAAARANGEWGLARGFVNWSSGLVLFLAVTLIAGFFILDFSSGLSTNSEYMTTMYWAVWLIPVAALIKLRGLALLALGHPVAGRLPELVLRPGLFALVLTGAWFASRGLDAPSAMALQLAAAAIALIAVSVGWRHYKPPALKDRAPEYKGRLWVASALPMGITEGLGLLQSQSALLLLGIIATTHAAGIYRVADSLALLTLVGQTVLTTASAPYFAYLNTKNATGEMQKLLSTIALGMVISTFLLGLPIALLGGDLLAWLFGEEFRASHTPFMVIWLAWLTKAAFGPVQAYANMTGRQNLVTIALLIGVTVAVIVSVVAIPGMGPPGGGLGLLSGILVANIWLWRTIRLLDGVNCAVFAPGTLRLLSVSKLKRLLLEGRQ